MSTTWTVVIRGKQGGILAGPAESAGHGDVHDLVEAILEDAVPKLHDLAGGGLGGGNGLMLLHRFVKLAAVNLDALQIHLFLDQDWHWQEVNPGILCFFLGNAAVGVG